MGLTNLFTYRWQQNPKKMTTQIPTQESENVEFKTSFNDDVIVSLVAFANHKGGSVFVGISDNGKITGVDLGKETIAQYLNEIKNKTAPVLLPEIASLFIDNKNVLKISTPEYPIKPVSTKGRYYKRVSNSNQQLDVSQVANLHLQSINSSWDSFPDTQHTIEDLSFEKIQAAIEKKKSIQKYLQDDPFNFLYKSGLMKNDSITNAAYLLFHKDDELISTVELGRFQTPILIKDSARSKSDIITQIEQIIDFVKKHINLEIIITGRPQNTQVWQYPLEAIREIVINMVIHRDYRSSSDSIVKVFNDYIEFYNPGRLPENITIDDLISNTQISKPRNKKVVHFLKEIGLIETFGTGIKKIISYCVKAGIPQPSFRNISDGFLVTIYSKEYSN